MVKLIGLCGLAGSGKTTASKYLFHERGFWRVPFAGPLKSMLHAAGLSEDHTDGALKEVPCDILGGNTPRRAMQLLGTEWGRSLSEDLWVNLWRIKADHLLGCGDPVVADDIRFANEAEAVRDMGGLVILVRRPGLDLKAGGHASEALALTWDIEVINDGTPEELYAKLDEITGIKAPTERGRCIPVDLGEQGTGYVVGLLTKTNRETLEVERAAKAQVYMISGPMTGMKITIACTPDLLREPTYN